MPPLTDLEDLPLEAQRTVEHINNGGPYRRGRPLRNGTHQIREGPGFTFNNDQGRLPTGPLTPGGPTPRYYEVRVRDPAVHGAGARRIVVDEANNIKYYTPDHYGTFQEIMEDVPPAPTVPPGGP